MEKIIYEQVVGVPLLPATSASFLGISVQRGTRLFYLEIHVVHQFFLRCPQIFR